MHGDAPISVTLAIDIEPDARMIARHESGGWKGFERLVDTLRSLRRTLPGKGGSPATFTWLLRADPQIRLAYGDSAYAIGRYRSMLDEFAGAGDDLGLHTHLYDWDLREQRWVTDFERPEWARTCVAESIGTYRDAFATEPRTHSFGDRYCSESILDQLEDSGIRCEMSTEPGLGAVDKGYPNELHRGWIPDTRHAPRSIWRPARGETWRHDPAGGRSLVMMPVSTYRFPPFFMAGRWLDMRRRQLRGKPGSMDERTQRYTRLSLEHRPYVLRYGLQQLQQEFAPGHLQFVYNSAQSLDDSMHRRFCAGMQYLCTSPGGRRYEFVSAMQSIAGCP